MSDVVEIRDLHITFETDAGEIPAVRGVDLALADREILAIVGESGSGKTVTAKSILRLLPDTADTDGVVLLRGRDVLTLDRSKLRGARGSDAAMVFQEPSTALNPVFPVGWQIAEGLRAHGRISRRAAKARAVEILRTVGIPDPETRVGHYPHQFSGGQKQRIVIAMALVLGPSVILADEPTTALDVTVQAEILDLLRRVRDEFGTAIVLITHNMGVVADLADRVAVMYRGELVEQAPVEQLFAAPQHEYTRKLLAAVPRVGERLSARRDPIVAGEAGAGAPAVEARGLVIQYPGRLGRPGFTAVDGVDLSIAPGEVLGLVGESGSGKTTIGRAIAGLTRVTGGSLTVLGAEMNGVSQKRFGPLRKDIGFVFQDPATSFNPLLTIADAIAEPMVVHGVVDRPARARSRVDELLDAVQLPASFGDRYPHELSGGQRQRASLARALALEPRLVVADEPTSALDVSVQARVLELFAELQQRFGFAALFISHDLAVIDEVSDRIAVMYRGSIVEQGTGDAVLRDPQHEYTRRLIASLPVPDPVEQRRRRGSTA
jgi:peptide/nickel transport system ATP-binding protein